MTSAALGSRRESGEHEADRTSADHEDLLSGLQPGILQALHHAGQRFGQGRVAELGARRSRSRFFCTKRSGITIDSA